LSSLLLLANLHKGDLAGYDDALYAHEAKQMLLTGDWWSIRLNGVSNFEFPPMFLWLEALSLKLFGLTDFAAKFPSAFLGLLTIILVFCIARQLSDDFWLPVSSAWVLMLSQYYMKYAMRAMTDVSFGFFFILALFLYIKGLKRPHYLIFCGLAAGAAILTRSVLGLIPLGIIFVHQITCGQTARPRLRYLLSGLLLALLLPFIWYFPQYRLYGVGFIARHFGFISSKVVVHEKFDKWRFMQGLLGYPMLLLRYYWPWLPLMAAGLIIHFRRMVREGELLSGLLIVWVTCMIIPLSLAEAKVLRYILPVFPAFSLLTATPLARWISQVSKEVYLHAGYTVLCGLVILIAAYPRPLLRAQDMKALAPIVDAHTEPDRRVMIYCGGEPHREDITNEFLWYSNRFYTYLTNPEKLQEALRASEVQTFIVDLESYERLILPSCVELKLLMQTKKFVSFRTVKNNGCDKL